MTEEEVFRREAREHQVAIDAARAVLATVTGQALFKYLFKEFAVAEVPEVGFEGNILHGMLGHYRAGESIFRLACEADAETASRILAVKEKERYAILYQESLDEPSE